MSTGLFTKTFFPDRSRTGFCFAPMKWVVALCFSCFPLFLFFLPCLFVSVCCCTVSFCVYRLLSFPFVFCFPHAVSFCFYQSPCVFFCSLSVARHLMPSKATVSPRAGFPFFFSARVQGRVGQVLFPGEPTSFWLQFPGLLVTRVFIHTSPR